MLDQIIQDDSNTVPYFLDGRREAHIRAMAQLHDIFTIIRDINYNEFLDEETLETMVSQIERKLNYINQIAGWEAYYKSVDWVRFRLASYLKYNLSQEYYEELQNLTALQNTLFKLKIKNEN